MYHYDIQPILNDIAGINLGFVYESAVAQELKAHYEKLFYYDNKQKGEVDFLVDDSGAMSVLLSRLNPERIIQFIVHWTT